MKEAHGRYCGNIHMLRNETALLMIDDNGQCRAQFDNRKLFYFDEALGFGWHAFPLDDFDILTILNQS